jgi:tetratricopeptide (TPR) repeat protein
MAIQINNDSFKKDVSVEIAYLFAAIEDYEKALEYLRKVNGRGNAEIFIATGQYDSAKYYYSLIDTSDQRQLRSYLDITGKWYLPRSNMIKPCPTLSGN